MAKKPDLYVVLDGESNAVEYGPSPDKKAAEDHLASLEAHDARGELSVTVGRKLAVYKLTEV